MFEREGYSLDRNELDIVKYDEFVGGRDYEPTAQTGELAITFEAGQELTLKVEGVDAIYRLRRAADKRVMQRFEGHSAYLGVAVWLCEEQLKHDVRLVRAIQSSNHLIIGERGFNKSQEQPLLSIYPTVPNDRNKRNALVINSSAGFKIEAQQEPHKIKLRRNAQKIIQIIFGN